ncbi:uncharacterized protein F5147DRAFT_651863 [Suillus discolor]|uniref:Uncharacterized protein n=1 Tax=Suillus discolor TaxID=1912936 RepID=A0A9P7F7Z3_9AGAM|nr:uncharacterized protein F5147DRAFT_651863 [Suillus discolor]KAG2110208.1 hypothetical protein F5147DRAFT_651863 [Suillus discolor]
MAQLSEEQKQLAQSLADLQSAITGLPGSLPEAAEDGPISHHLHDLSVDEDEGPFYSFNRAWERVFQCSEEEQQKLVVRGKHGIILAHNFAAHFAALPKIEQHDGLNLMNERIEVLIKLLHDVAPTGTSKKAASGLFLRIKRTLAKDAESDLDDHDYVPPHKDPVSDNGSISDIEAIPANGKSGMPKKKKQKTWARSEKSESEIDVEEVEVHAGQNPLKGQWAMLQFVPSLATNKKGDPVWKWKCNWCELPREHSFNSWCAQKSNGVQVSVETPGPGPQRQIMQDFVQRGIEHPAKQLTRKTWHETLVKGIVEDDLPYSLVEKRGMKRTFTLILPTGYSLPSRQTTSKNSVYAFLGSVVSWINDEWELMQTPLELIPLDGDHSGKVSGKLLFKVLKHWKLTSKIILTKYNTGRAILHGLHCAPDPEEEDLYESARQFLITYSPEDDPEVQQEMEEMRKEAAKNNDEDDPLNAESDAYVSSDDENAVPMGKSARKAKKSQHLTAVEKASCFDILASEICWKWMRRLIRQLCDARYKGLVPIRSIPIRWNTTLAEIDRAMKLKPAINQWVDQLDACLTGVKKRAAICKKKKLALSLFYTSTLDLSCKHVPTICYTLPLYKQLELHMDTYCRQASEENDIHGLEDALTAGLNKLRIHMEKALVSDYPLLGAVLHPRMRVSYFDDETLWSHTNLAARMYTLRTVQTTPPSLPLLVPWILSHPSNVLLSRSQNTLFLIIERVSHSSQYSCATVDDSAIDVKVLEYKDQHADD